jgi:hypothetical protein
MPRFLIFLSGVCFAASIVLALRTGYEVFTTGHLELCLLRVEDAAELGRTTRAAAYFRELGWLGALALAILLFQLGSRIDENNRG